MSNILKKESYRVTSLGRYTQCGVGRDFCDWKLIRNLLQLFKQKVLKAGIKRVEGQRGGYDRYRTKEEFTGFND